MMNVLYLVFVLLQFGEEVTSEMDGDVAQRLLTTIEKMEQSMFNMNQTIEAVRNENNRLKSEISELKMNNEKVTNLTSELAGNTSHKFSVLRGMTAEARTLVEEVSTKQRQVSNLQTQQGQQIMRVGEQIMHVKTEVNSLRTEQQQKISRVQTDVAKLKRDMPKKIYFSVYMTQGEFHPSEGQTIPFSGVYVDSDNNYSSNKFRCPVTGYYFFTFSIYSGKLEGGFKRTNAQLIVNGQHRAEVNSWDSNWGGQAYLQPANSIITHCSAGEHVWLKARYGGERIYGSSSYRRTTFSGFLMD